MCFIENKNKFKKRFKLSFPTVKYFLKVSNKHDSAVLKMLLGWLENPQNKKGRTKSNKSTQTKIFCDNILGFNVKCRKVFLYFDGVSCYHCTSRKYIESVTLLKMNSSITDELYLKFKNILKTHICRNRNSRLQAFFKIVLVKNFSKENTFAGVPF